MVKWTAEDEAQLLAMLARKGRTEVQEASFESPEVTETRVLMVENCLNNILRKGKLPALKYSRTQRLTLQLMSDLQLVPQFNPGFVSVTKTTGDRVVSISHSFKNEDGRVKALMTATAECAVKVLLAMEMDHGTSTANLGV